MKITQRDIWELQSLAKKDFLDIGEGQRLPGMNCPLSHDEKLAVAFLQASVRLLIQMGVKDLRSLEVEMENPDSDPDTEYADWEAVEEPEDP